MTLPLYLVESAGQPRNHHALFVCVEQKEESGWLFNVTGNIQSGMTYEEKSAEAPRQSLTFESMSVLGRVPSSSLQQISSICRSNPPPEKQFDGPKRIDSKKPLRRCQEWTAETIQLLEQEGLLQRDGEQRGSVPS